MPIHREAVGRAEGPRRRLVDAVALAEGPPQAQQRLLHDILGLLVTKPETPSESPQLLAMAGMHLLDSEPVAGQRRIRIAHGHLMLGYHHTWLTYGSSDVLHSRRGSAAPRIAVRQAPQGLRGQPDPVGPIVGLVVDLVAGLLELEGPQQIVIDRHPPGPIRRKE